MKKLIFILVCLLSAGMVFAATSATLTGTTTTGSAEVTIKLPLASSDAFESVEIGFSSSEITSGETNDAVIEATPAPVSSELSLKEDGDGTASLDASSPLYAYWLIKSKDTVTVSLYLEKALTGETDSNTINWAVTAGDKGTAGSTTDAKYGDQNTVEINKVTKNSDTMQYSAGSVALTIDTADYSEKAIDDYSANIVLAVKIE